jgi:thioredoxin-like negative regulator of GroEL
MTTQVKPIPIFLVLTIIAYVIGLVVLGATLTGCTAPDPRQALNLMGKAVEELNKKAQLAIEDNRLADADKFLTAAKELMPENPALAFNLATVQLSEGRLLAAETAFEGLQKNIPAELSERLTLKRLEVASQIVSQLEHPDTIVAYDGMSKQAVETALLRGMTKQARIQTLKCDIQKAFKALKTATLKDSAKPWMAGMKIS